MMTRWWLALGVLAGCGGPDAQVWLVEGFSYGWQGFNHRASHVEFGIEPSEDGLATSAAVAVVGGTSTTGVVSQLADTCDVDTCDEFPWVDSATIGVHAVEGVIPGSVTQTASVELIADKAGADSEVVFSFDKAPPHDSAFASIVGWTIDTDVPTTDGLEHCYNPKNGWHPQRLAIELGEAEVSDDVKTVRVPVHAVFAAGNSLEEERGCVDEINEFAAARMKVDVRVIVGNAQIESQNIDQWAQYAYGDGPMNPEEQPAPQDGFRDLDLPKDGAIYGWQRLDWEFHVGDAEARGAYLRTLSFGVDPDAATVVGHATNYSPGTQLSGFDYHFGGKVSSVNAESITRRFGEVLVPAAFDDAGQPIVTSLPLEPK